LSATLGSGSAGASIAGVSPSQAKRAAPLPIDPAIAITASATTSTPAMIAAAANHGCPADPSLSRPTPTLNSTDFYQTSSHYWVALNGHFSGTCAGDSINV
jgi:hypothetical protein